VDEKVCTSWVLKERAILPMRRQSPQSGAIDIARLLLDAGADPDIRDDKYNATALGWADFFGRADFADLIRGRGGAK
jgi:ankyrin repeat protein